MLTFGSFHFVATKTAILQLNLLVNTVITKQPDAAHHRRWRHL